MPLFHFNSVFSNDVWFNRKMVNTVQFFIIKIRISIIFKHLQSKLTSEICPKVGGLGRKTDQNHLKVTTLPPFFFQKTTVFVEKRKTLVDFM